MKKLRFFLLSFFCCCFLFSCASYVRNSAIIDNKVSNKIYLKYIGKTESEIIKIFGFPTRYESLNDEKVMIYERTIEAKSYDDRGNEITTTRSDKDTYLNFFLDKNGVVQDWKTNSVDLFYSKMSAWDLRN